MRLLPTSQAAKELHLHRNTLHRYRREGLLKAGTYWYRQGPWRNAGFLYDVDACLELFGHGRLTLRYVFSSLTAKSCTKPNKICKAM